ncbi:MAG: hypothetical protein GY803_15815 [Chloroflexi bacterium]|nr:hypothetical protein [Chloroflexota bacterium]
MFEWQTDKEHEWTDKAEPMGEAVSWRRRWRLWLALFLIFVVVAGVGFAWLNRRATVTENRIADDALSSHRLLQQSIANRDEELFAALLFSYYRRWEEAQQKLFERRLFVDRSPLGLWAAPHLADSEPAVTMAPDLETAVITSPIPYIIEKSDGVTETVVLEHTAVYQRSDSQWLLAPPPDDDSFWGQKITVKGSLLELSFPERDAEIGYRLAADLDEVVGEMCELTAVSCPPTFGIRLKLDSDYTQMLTLDEDYRLIRPGRFGVNVYRFALPAPTLIGRPVDEDGYQALLRGYAGWLTAVLINDFDRAQQPSRADIARQLAYIGLLPPPSSRERPWQPQTSPPIPWPEQDILLLCRPRGDGNMPASVWRYELAESNWIDETAAFAAADPAMLVAPNSLLLLSMPDDDGAVAMSFDFSDLADGRIFLWRNGVVTALAETAPTHSWMPSIFVLPGDAQERFLVFYQPGDETNEEITFGWLDLAHCPGPACQLQTGDALPLWSPNAKATVLIQTGQDDMPTLSLGDAQGRETVALGAGWSPAWVDDTAVAYLRPDASLEPIENVTELTSTELGLIDWTAPAVSSPLQTLINSADLLATLPENGRPDQLLMYAVIADPARPDQLFIQATTALGGVAGRDYLFAFDRQGRDVSLILSLDDRIQGTAQVEGNGRYLATISMENNNPVYLLHDLESHRTVTTYPFAPAFFIGADWSANGDWLVMMDDDAMRLIVPGSRYERPIFHGVGECGAAVWVNK